MKYEYDENTGLKKHELLCYNSDGFMSTTFFCSIFSFQFIVGNMTQTVGEILFQYGISRFNTELNVTRGYNNAV